MTPRDRFRVANCEAAIETIERGCERTRETTRVVTGFPPIDPITRLEQPRLAAALQVLALQPSTDTMTIRARCPGAGEPVQVLVGHSRRFVGVSEDCEIVESGLDALLAFVWPEATFGNVSRSVLPLSVKIQIRPESLPTSSPVTGRLITEHDQTDASIILVERLSARKFDVTGALSVLALQAPSELILRLSSFVPNARTLRAVESFDLRRQAGAFVFPGPLASDDALAGFLAAFRAARRGVRIEVTAAFAEDPDPMVLDLVSAALYGAPIDHRTSDIPDLRSVWPVGWSLPHLLPSEQCLHRFIERARPARASLVLPAGSVSLGRLSVSQEEVVLLPRDRARHCFCIGGTGSGKSTLLLNLLQQDINGGEGVILIDPHGDLADAARELVPSRRREDLIWADLSNPSSAVGLNILEGQGGEPELERNYICNQLINLFKNVLYRDVPEAFGPMFEVYFRNALMLLMSGGGPDANLMDFERVFHDGNFRDGLIARSPDRKLREFWKEVAEKATYSEISLENVTPYIVCKLTQLTGNPLVRRMIDVRKSELDLRRAMDAANIVLIKLAKGLIGEYDTSLIATLLTIRIAQACMGRANMPPRERRPVRLYIDEFQNCAGDSLAGMLSESRKYGVSLTLANQSLSQVDGRRTHNNAGEAALANAGNLIVCRVGAPDAAKLAPWFEPDLDWQALCRLPDFTAAVRVLNEGQPAAVQTIRLPPPPSRLD